MLRWQNCGELIKQFPKAPKAEKDAKNSKAVQ